MMVETLKTKLKQALTLLIASAAGLFLCCGCTNGGKVINTLQMPGHRVSDMVHGVNQKKRETKINGLTRTKSGVYIYKDNATINTTGYEFNIKENTNVGPSDVKFDAERLKTRY